MSRAVLELAWKQSLPLQLPVIVYTSCIIISSGRKSRPGIRHSCNGIDHDYRKLYYSYNVLAALYPFTMQNNGLLFIQDYGSKGKYF